MNPAITNLAITLIMMQVSKKVPFEDENVLLGVRAMYVLSNIIIISIYLYTKTIINKKNDLTAMKYVEPASPLGGQTEEKLVETTVKAYDLAQVDSAIKGMFTGIAMMGFMHIYMKYTNPLLIQSILPVKSALESNIVKIHLFGQPASGDLKRPFKVANMFAGLTGQEEEPVTEKKPVEEAEKTGTAGIKEE